MKLLELNVGNSTLVEIDLAKDAAAGTYLNAATASARLYKVEQQTVEVSAATGGGWWLHVTINSKLRSTERLAYNVLGPRLEQELRRITGLKSLRVLSHYVAATNTIKHTVTFLGLVGDVAIMTSTTDFMGGVGTVAHATIDVGGEAVTNGGPVTLSYVAASNGRYQGTLAANAAIVDGEYYDLEVNFAESGKTALLHVPCVARWRDAD